MNPARLHVRRTAAILAVFAFALSVHAATYPINLTPPWKPNQVYTNSVKASESTRTTVSQGTQVLQEQIQIRKAAVEADGEALALHPNGGLRKAAFTVRSFRTSISSAAETDFLPAGTKITVETTGPNQSVYTVNGRAATAEQEPFLKLVFSTDTPDYNDQVLFGTGKPVAVGESWQPDVEKLKSTFGHELGPIAIAKASMKLDAVSGSGDQQVSSISGTVDFGGFSPPLPPGITAKGGTFHIALDGLIPASRTAAKRVENLTATAVFGGEVKAPTGAIITINVTAEAKHASTLTFP
jgi:hypothetical protein